MKCRNCGANLIKKDGEYYCEFCNSTYLREEIEPKSNRKTINTSEFNVQNGVLVKYNGKGKDVVIPNGVFSIGERAFWGNLDINSVEFSDTVNTIENNAFEGCKNLRAILKSEKISYYKNECFRGSGLKEVYIGESVFLLGKNCFSDMVELEKIVYKPKKNLVLDHTFSNCQSIKTVETDREYFFPAFVPKREVKNNPNNKRYTLFDAFSHTVYLGKIKEIYKKNYKEGICPECNGQIKKTLFHAKCQNCGIDYKN